MSQHTRVLSASTTSPFWQRSRPSSVSPRTPLSWHPRTPQPGPSLTRPARPARPAQPTRPSPTVAGSPTPAPPAALQIRSCIFCASLQDRPAWAPVVPLLLASSKTAATPRWERARLSSHDLAIRIGAGAGARARDTDTDTDTDIVCRFLLVAPADVGRPETASRVQRLQRLQQQRRRGDAPTAQSIAAVLFLLTPSTGAGSSNTGSGSGGSTPQFTHRASMADYEQLQALLHASDGETSSTGPPLALLPVPAVEAVPATLAAFYGPLTRPTAQQQSAGRMQDGDDHHHHDNARGVLCSTAAALGLPRPDEAVDRLVAQAAAAAGDGRGSIACADVLLACLGTDGKKR